MKGIVFSEFMEMVEGHFGYEMADQIVVPEQLPSGGVYTAVGAYDHKEMVTLVSNLSTHSGTPVPDLLYAFGKHLFERFTVGYPVFFERVSDAFDFLYGIEDHIHVEVKKLYPDAELPRFTVERPSKDHLIMVYHSSRGMADLALGLITGCIEYFKEDIQVEREDLNGSHHSRFTLYRNSPAA